ncbi:MAG: excinuclease ABC subunit UvrA [Candidatus Dadabacteria bacterium]|nr:MAG: excinuclease ABC subunit UvrA [Candidatus Dadabacteria bacterium]
MAHSTEHDTTTALPDSSGPSHIRVRGARMHNLKNVDVDLPRNRLVVITGLSGSGKSTLAFDTLYAEGQRRYVESLSAYARQFLDQMDKPDVESIEGLSPAISIEQRNSGRTPRSTVGTVTEVYDYLRVLFARIGTPYCPGCGKPIERWTVDQMVDAVLQLPERSRITINAPIVRGRKGEYRELFDRLRREGFARVEIDGEQHLLEDPIDLDRKRPHDIDLVIDRLVIREGIRSRLASSIESALQQAEGLVRIVPLSGEHEPMLMSEAHGCADCGISFPELEPRAFSFNAPQGACPDCHGIGILRVFDARLVVPDPDRPIADGAIAPWAGRRRTYIDQLLQGLSDRFDFRLDRSFGSLEPELQKILLYGPPANEPVDIEISLRSKNGRSRYSFKKRFPGIIPMLEERYRDTESAAVREELEQYMTDQPCPSCNGSGLRPEILAVRIGQHNIAEVTAMTIGDASAWIETLTLGERDRKVAERALAEVRERLRFLIDVGLGYLTLSRKAATLSGGEEQRIRLATQLGNALTGVLYILDEPSIGLHPADHDRLLRTLLRLRDRGNSVLVVEHDEATIRAADWIVDLGPGAGRHGGQVIAQGPPDAIEQSKTSLTGAYLSGRKSIPIPGRRREPCDWIQIRGAAAHNLRNVDVDIPVGCLVAVTGVSGSGKSTLVLDTLYPAMHNRLHKTHKAVGQLDAISGLEHFKKVIDIDQAPIGRTPRSNPATYVDLFTPIRQLFASVPESRARGYAAGRFSFNVRGGRCEACEGAGVVKIEMHFLPDVFVTCEQCRGHRYNRETLEIRYKGKNISEVLDMTIEEAAEFFAAIPVLHRKLSLLNEVGLGYLQLGQPATTLSGGEAQRIKLARELTRKATGDTLYILDEPTTGLHIEDVRKLLEVLQRLASQGSTVVVIEHHMDVVKAADWVIDLGPGGGANGGRIVAAGTPEQVAANSESLTGQWLRPLLAADRM